MQLRPKITLLLVSAIAGCVALSYVIQRLAVLPSFRALEQADAIENWQRCRNAIDRDIEALSQICFDWAAWDHAHDYVRGLNPDFFSENLANDDWYIDQEIDVLYFCKPDGEIYWKHVAELEPGVPMELAWLPGDRLPVGHPLMAVTADKDSKVVGLMQTRIGIVMFAARPILTSEYKGPMAGVLIFGRRISDDRVASLCEQTGVQFSLRHTPGADRPPPPLPISAAPSQPAAPTEQLISADQLTVRGAVNDLEGRPTMLIQTTGDREISQRGQASLLFATWSLIVAGLLTLAALLLAMRRSVIKPLLALTNHAARVGESGELDHHFDLGRRDEIGALARSFSQMLLQLNEFRSSSITMSRQAGMAEVAKGVLHNVGNAMTNVNVLAETLGAKLSGSRVSSLAKVSTLLEEHRSDLPAFLAQNPQGSQIPDYLSQLSLRLETENRAMQKDLSSLREGLEHIKLIVASHQGLATSSSFDEKTDLSEIANESLHLLEASLCRHDIRASVQIQSPAEVWGDRSKIAQVLVNLLTNAKESLVASGTPEPRIVLRLGRAGADAAFVEVRDNGPGVPLENIDKLFSKGFSTKVGGQGIGLHYCWLAAREMDGTLRFNPDDSSAPVSFRLELPVRASAERAAA